MNYSCLLYEPSLRPLYESLQKTCREQEMGSFPVPEVSEGEQGVLILCREGERILGAFSAVTFDCSQYFFYPWCLEAYRQEVGTALFQKLEAYLLETQKSPLLLSAYVNGGAAGTARILKEQGYTCTTGEYMMRFDVSQSSFPTDGTGSAPEIQCTPCCDKKLLNRLYEDIFSTGKKEAASYIASVMEEPGVQMYCISGRIPCIASEKGFLRGRGLRKKLGVLGMFGLLPQGDTVYLFGFGILSSFRRQGLGLAALEEISAMVRYQYEKLAVQVSADNKPALELYRSFGFQVQEHVELYEKELHAPSFQTSAI